MTSSPVNRSYGLSVMAGRPTLAESETRALLSLESRVHIQWLETRGSGPHILEMLAPGTGKWTSRRRVASAEGIGDDLNDLDLVSNAALGIAMGNAVRELRAAADLVVAGNDRDGVVDAIEAALRS
jgi:hydroxymethylpyrimidine pyrophosphatase-like HAD family hydrolase